MLIFAAWDYDKIYRYYFTGRSVSAVHQLFHQYVGVSIKGHVQIKKTSHNQLFVEVS